MFINYFKVAFRNIKKDKFGSIINISGLALGILACIIVGTYIRQELNYDDFNLNAENIYRVYFSNESEGREIFVASTPAQLGPIFKKIYPEVKEMSRIYFKKQALVQWDNKKYYEKKLTYADSTFFDVFSFEAIAGNKNQFLKKANTIILTQTTAEKYFGNENPIGKTIKVDNKYDFEVAGVIKDVPDNAHFTFDFIATYSSLKRQQEKVFLDQWGATFGSYTYIQIQPGVIKSDFAKKIKGFFQERTNLHDWNAHLMKLTDIHLLSHFEEEIEANSSIQKLVVIGSIALFVLILAGINFVNLSTVKSTKRAPEIGIRKTLGSEPIQIIKQFLSESVLLALLALTLAISILIILNQHLTNLFGLEINILQKIDLLQSSLILLGVLIVGFLAGIYPAFFVSSFQPVKVISSNNSSRGSGKNSFLRKGLVVFQFVISIILISGTLIVNMQHKYLCDFNMGFNKDHMVVLPVHKSVGENYQTIKNELLNLSGVDKVVACEGAPVSLEGIGTECRPKGLDYPDSFPIHVNSIDTEYFQHFGVKIIAGHNFKYSSPNGSNTEMVINETMVKKLGFSNPQEAIGKSYFISLNGYKPQIIGVVKDYNFNSLHNEISAQVFLNKPYWFSEFVVQIKSENISSTIQKLQNKWASFFPEFPFEYNFLDQKIDDLYKAEEKVSELISSFSAIAIIIACMGLLGLVAFISEQRKKEIGIRKVLGASIMGIINNLSKDFLFFVLLANIIAWPVSYYFMNKWLQDFSYRIEISWWIFALAGLINLLIVIAVVGMQTFRAASVNPINSLKYE